MAEPFLSEIRLFSFGFAPKGWALCDGQLLPINQNEALFSLLGTTYGGDGQVNFGLPDLQGRVPLHMGNNHTLGEKGGEQTHTLNVNELPGHTHTVMASSNSPTVNTPANNLWASQTGFSPYATSSNESMNPAAISSVGGSQAHLNLQPFLVINFCIALQGIFPSQT
ncbi:MAG: tail fiber protein [Acidobacteriia bacterium]|nr:tail fiber protein [Terriglobia bacterium]